MKFKLPFKIFSSTVQDGIRVVRRASPGSAAVLEHRYGGDSDLLVVPSHGVLVTRVLDGTRSQLVVQFGHTKAMDVAAFSDAPGGFRPRMPRDIWVRAPGSEQLCNEEYDRLMTGLAKSAISRKAIVIGALLVLALFLAFSGSSSSSSANVAALTPPDVSDAMAREPATQSNTSSRLDPGEMSLLKTGFPIAMRKAGQSFTVFSDPNCPFCRELELGLSKVDASLNPNILPLGFKPGSRELAASILCSKDPATAWRKSLLEGIAPTTPPCDDGYRKVDANMALFTSLKLTSTPTMVSPAGQLVVGSGSPEMIADVMRR